MFEKNASSYYNYGVGVIPMLRNSKASFIKYAYFNDSNSVPSLKDYETWERLFPKANIAVLCGQRSGITLIDIDTDDKDVLNFCPKSPLVKFGQRGETRFFRSSAEPTLHLNDVDVLGDRSITFAPPSIHYKTGKPYIWKTKELWFDNLEDFPFLTTEFMQELQARFSKTPLGGSKSFYLRQSDGTRCQHGSHLKINSMINAALRSGDTPQEVLATILEFDEKHNAEISYFLCPTRKEFRSKNRVANAMQCISSVIDSLDRKNELPEIKTTTTKIQIVDTKQLDDSYKKESLPHLRGFGDMLFKDIYKNSPIPRSRFAAASTLSIISTLLGNRCHFSGVLPNLYSLLIAPSGYGKDFPLEYAKDLFIESTLPEIINCEFKSDSALINRFPKQRVQLFVIKEAAALFKGMTTSTSSHTLQIADTLADLFSSSGKHYGGKMRQKDFDNNSGSALGRCFSPYCSIIASMTLSSFKDSVTAEFLNAGAGARIFYFIDCEFKDTAIPIKTTLKVINPEIKNFVKRFKTTSISLEPTTKFDIPHLKFTKNAESAIMELQTEYINERKNATSDHIAVSNRAYELFLKLAQIDTACVNIDKPIKTWVVDIENVFWAHNFYSAQLKDVKKLLTENIFSSEEGRCIQDFEDIIKAAGKNGIMRKDLFLKTRKIKFTNRSRDYIINVLLEEGTIFESKVSASGSKGGPRPTFYFHKFFVKS